jgi:hypothetical protein
LVTRLHPNNRGYGANQKTCYAIALELGADIVVMVHPDYQYSPLLVPAMAAMIAYGEYDFVLGSRTLAQSAVARGMPRYKYVSNRVLTLVENVLLGQKLSEYHTGLRAYRRELLESIPLAKHSDDFIFDNQIIVQAIAAGARIVEISCPTRYNDDASSINFRRSVRYGLGVLRTAAEFRLQKHGLRHRPFLGQVSPLEARVASPEGSDPPATFARELGENRVREHGCQCSVRCEHRTVSQLTPEHTRATGADRKRSRRPRKRFEVR